jgi:hypothetical protein
MFNYYSDSGITWFRIFGFGLLWKDKRKAKLLFSERYKIGCLHIGNYVVKLLKPLRGGIISEVQCPDYGSILKIPKERLKCLKR